MKLYTLEARDRVKGSKWWLCHTDFKLTKVREIQKALSENWAEPHDFRIRVWKR